MRNTLMAVCLAAASCGSALAADTYTIDPGHTFPRFEVSHFGFSTHRGQFNKTSGRLVLDRADKSGSVEIVIATASISTGDPALEEHLRSPDYFDVERFPLMTYKSRSVKFDGDMPVLAEGDFTLHGVTRSLTLAVSNVKCGFHPIAKKEACGAEVSGRLKSSDFGMTTSVPAIGDDVTLRIQVEARKD
jgi:polyisoprenoid-binding protein YceI